MDMNTNAKQHQTPIIVVGAGIVGITTAYVLQASGKYAVTVVAEYLPLPTLSDAYTTSAAPAWASPFAGGNWHGYAKLDQTDLQQKELFTLHMLQKLCDLYPDSSIKRVKGYEYRKAADYIEPYFIRHISGVRYIPTSELPPQGIDVGVEFDTVVFNAPEYLAWLARKFVAIGGVLRQSTRLSSLSDALKYAPTPSSPSSNENNNGAGVVVVNCTGLGSRYLVDVADAAVTPARGHVVLVRSPECQDVTVSDESEWFYVIPRGNGTVILGGTYDIGNWSQTTNPDTTTRILQNTIRLCPQLIGEPATSHTTAQNIDDRVAKLRERIVSEHVGFRPMRVGGVRLELSQLDVGNVPVVHNYGHGGYGYQSSWGYAYGAMKLVDQAVNSSCSVGPKHTQSKL